MSVSATATGRPLRAGVVGVGWAGQQHMAGYDALPDVELVAIAAKEDDKVAALADRYRAPGRYDDLETMLSDADLDVVSLATPTAMHAPMSVTALDAGVHVLCEKPMAESAERANAMVAAAEANNRVLEVTFNKRRGRETVALSRAIEEGVLGEVYYVKAGWVRRRGIPGLGTWFTRKAMAGGGPMMDIGIHVLDMALHVMGEPEVSTVSGATYAQFGPRGLGGSGGGSNKWGADDGDRPFEVEDLGTAFVRMGSGATLLLEASWAQFVPRDRIYLEVYGSEGSAALELAVGSRPGSLTLTTDVAGMPAVIEPDLGPEGGHAEAVADFVAAVRSGDWAGHRGQVGLKRTAIIDACYASADSGSEVSLG